MDEKNLKVIRYLTGAMFITMALTWIPSVLSYWGSGFIWLFVSILGFAGALLSALAMFSGTYSLFAVGVGMLALQDLISLRGVTICRNIFLLIAYILLVVAVFQKKNTGVIGIISALLFIISDLIFQIIVNNNWWGIFYSVESSACEAAGAFLACLVLQNAPQTQTAKIKQPAIARKTDNRIEELTKLKDLLDTGVITQEEFDAKKQQLLQI